MRSNPTSNGHASPFSAWLRRLRHARDGAHGALAKSIRHRRTVVVVAILLAALTPVPLLHSLGGALLPSPQDLSTAPGLATPSATTLPTGTPGTADPHGLDWTTALQDTAQQAYVGDLIAHMSLDEEIGQMLITGVLSDEMTPDLATKIQEYHVGGAILYANNIVSSAQVRALTHAMQAKATIPLMIQVDQEGGTVNRLKAIDGNIPSAEEIGATNDPKVARQRGLADGQQLYSLGINANLAPVVDVQGLPDGQGVMTQRMFGWTPDKVTTMAGAYLAGEQQDHRVIGTLKHFPGAGDVAGDPHYSAIYLTRSLDELERIDWAPYRALIASGQVGMIMTTHIILTAVDPATPTTLSYPVTTGLLRNRLGFSGVIVTDDLYMEALRYHYSFEQEVVQSVLAGNDLISSVYTLGATEQAQRILQRAVASGTISKQRIDDSVRRILLLKLRYGVLKPPSAG